MVRKRSSRSADALVTSLAVVLAGLGGLSGLSSHAAGVTIGPGVVFAPSDSWANISFTASQFFGTIQVDPTGVTFDSNRLGAGKSPASLPKATIAISSWDPLQTIVNGSVLVFSGDAPTGSSLAFSLSNLIPAREYLLQVDGVSAGSQFSDPTGFVVFTWSTFSVHAFSVLLGSRTGLPPLPVPLSADFAFAPQTPGVNQSVTFSGTAGGGHPPYNYSWMFGDGTSAVGPSVGHAYGTPGNETVVLTVFDLSAATATATKTVTVLASSPPPSLYVNFAFAPASPYPGTPVTFGSVVSGGAPPYNYTWSFGDGSLGFAPSVVHTYGRSGISQVRIGVRDSVGAIATATSNVTVKAVPTVSPGNVTAAFDEFINGVMVTFADRSSSDRGLPIVVRFWAFGDGTSSKEENPVHTYPASRIYATYTVILAVCDSGSHCGAVSRSISLVNGTLLATILIPVLAIVSGWVAFFLWWRRKKSPVRRRGV